MTLSLLLDLTILTLWYQPNFADPLIYTAPSGTTGRNLIAYHPQVDKHLYVFAIQVGDNSGQPFFPLFPPFFSKLAERPKLPAELATFQDVKVS